MYAMLGEIPFELLESFQEFSEKHQAAFARHEVLQGRPRLQAMGNALTELSFGLRLHHALSPPDQSYRALVAAKEAQRALALVFGSGRMMGRFVIDSLEVRTLVQDGEGRTKARELSLTLSEYVGDPPKNKNAPGIHPGQNPLSGLLPQAAVEKLGKVEAAPTRALKTYTTATRLLAEAQTMAAAVKNGDLTAILTALSRVAEDLKLPAEVRQSLSGLQAAQQLIAQGAAAAGSLAQAVSAYRRADAASGLAALTRSAQSLATATHGAQRLIGTLATRKPL